MTLSLGAELTGSSLIMMISSPGISLPSDGPPEQTHQEFKWNKPSVEISQFLKVLMSVYWALITSMSHQHERHPERGFLSLFFFSYLHSGDVHRRCAPIPPEWVTAEAVVTLPGVTERTTTGFSLPATKPKPSTGSLLISTFRGAGGTNLSPSRRTSSRELLCDTWLQRRQGRLVFFCLFVWMFVILSGPLHLRVPRVKKTPHIHMSTGNLNNAINLQPPISGGRKPEYPECDYTGRVYKLHAERPQSSNQPQE